MPAATTEAPVSQRAAYAVRPTVLVDGQQSALVHDNLRTCVVSEADGGLSSLALGLGNWGISDGSVGPLFDAGGPLALGTRLKVYFGETSSPCALFDGEVHAIEAKASVGTPPEILLLAEDALFALRCARRTAVYQNQSLGDLVRAVAGRHGLPCDLGELPEGSANHAQLNESDLAFLRRVLARHDCDLQVNDGQLQVRRCGDRERGTLALALYSQLQKVRVVADLAHQVSGVSAGGFDLAGGSAYNASSRGAHPGAGSGTTGSSLLPGTGQRAEHLAPLACTDQAEAQALADAAFDQRARRFVRVHGSTEGNPQLRVGTRLRLSGIGRRFDNSYEVVEAHHRFDQAGGYATDFVAQSAYLAQA
jgi:uncharacterized protein